MTISSKQIQRTIVVKASVDELWRLWTTRDGINSFFGEDSKIELTIGGAFEIYFLMDNPAGLRGSEGCKVLSFLPLKMLSFSWNSPPQFPDIRSSDYKTWVVINFTELESGQVEVKLSHTGWPDESAWEPVFNYFEAAWGRVMQNLKARF